MNRRHAIVIAAVLALAVVLGAAAALRTAGRGADTTPAGKLAVRNAQLDRYEAQLRSAANARPPALPAATPAAAKAPQRVVYVRAQQAAEPDHHDDGDHNDGDHDDGHDRHDGAGEHHDRGGHDDD